MASKLVLSLSLPSNPIKSADKRNNLRRVANELIKYASGQSPTTITCDARHTCTAATGTVTLAACAAADTVTINGVTFTASSTPSGESEFEIDGDNTADAAALVAKINAHSNALITGLVTASNVLGVVTITATIPGKTGNCITLASSNGTRAAVSGARLTGGAETKVSV